MFSKKKIYFILIIIINKFFFFIFRNKKNNKKIHIIYIKLIYLLFFELKPLILLVKMDEI